MKSPTHCYPGKALWLALACAGSFGFPNLRADDATATTASTVPDVTSATASQQEVRDNSRKVNDDLQAIVDDMKQNGLSDAQIATLLQTSDKLDTVNQQDMQKIIDLFQSIHAMPQANDQQAALLEAYQQQKAVSTELKDLALDLARQASIEAVIKQVESLIVRQAENIRNTERLQKVEGQTIVRYDVQKRLTSRITVEQAAIGQDTAILARTLTTAQHPPDDPSVTMTLAPDAAQLQSASAEAASQTSLGQLPMALTYQQELKDKLLLTLAVWKAKQDTETRLQQARAQVEALLKEQTTLAAITAHTNRGNDALAERQAKVADQADLTQDIAQLDPQAGAEMAQAKEQMKQSAEAMTPSSDVSEARPAQASTLTALSDVAKVLTQQATALEAKTNEPLTDRMQDLQGLKQQIDQAQQSAQTKADPTILAQVAQLQKEAAPLSPEAADRLADAAGKLQQPQPDAGAAAGKLGDASKSVQKQIDALTGPARDYEALAKANDLLKEAVEKSADANSSLKDPAHPNKDRVAGDLNTAEGDVDQLDSTVGAKFPEAHATLQQAAGELKAGGVASANGDQPGGQGHVEAGLKILTDAQKKLAQAKKEAQQQGMAAIEKASTGAQRLAQNEDQNSEKVSDPDQDQHPLDTGLVKAGRDLPGTGPAQVVGTLSSKDRDALIQTEAEKVPPDYAPMVQQYMKNLSDSSSK